MKLVAAPAIVNMVAVYGSPRLEVGGYYQWKILGMSIEGMGINFFILKIHDEVIIFIPWSMAV